MTPAARSLKYLRKEGFIACAIERWIPVANIHADAFGFGDLLAAHPERKIVLLAQSTSIDHVAHRLTKAKGKPELAAWLRAGGTFEVHGWCLRGGRWQVKRIAVQAGDLESVVLAMPKRR